MISDIAPHLPAGMPLGEAMAAWHTQARAAGLTYRTLAPDARGQHRVELNPGEPPFTLVADRGPGGVVVRPCHDPTEIPTVLGGDDYPLLAYCRDGIPGLERGATHAEIHRGLGGIVDARAPERIVKARHRQDGGGEWLNVEREVFHMLYAHVELWAEEELGLWWHRLEDREDDITVTTEWLNPPRPDRD